MDARSINDLMNVKRRTLYADMYKLADKFVEELYDYISKNSIFDKNLDAKYFGVSIVSIDKNYESVLFDYESFWALTEKEFDETKKELIEIGDVREDIGTYFLNNEKSIYNLKLSECDIGMLFKILEEMNFIPFLKENYSIRKERNIENLKIAVFFRVDF